MTVQLVQHVTPRRKKWRCPGTSFVEVEAGVDCA